MAWKTKRLKLNEIRVIKLDKTGIFRVLIDVLNEVDGDIFNYASRVGVETSTTLTASFDELIHYVCCINQDTDEWVGINNYINEYFNNNLSVTAESLYKKNCYKRFFLSDERPYSMCETLTVKGTRSKPLKKNEIRVVKLNKEGISEILHKTFQNIGFEKLGLFKNAKSVSVRMNYDNLINELTFYVFHSSRTDVYNIEKYISENVGITTDDLFYPKGDKPYKVILF